MINPEMVPDEVVVAAAKELAHTNGWRNQQGVEVCKPVVIDIIAAAINAWPGAEYVYRQPHRRAVSYTKPALILPLAQEPRDD